MSKLLRYYTDGNIYFVTVVTAGRAPILTEYNGQLKSSIERYRTTMGFTVLAYVYLPDHFHMIIDPRQNNLSLILQKIKLSFSRKIRYLEKSSGRVWQRRFWDHIIRDDTDMIRHINYIHFNPVKHGLVDDPMKWPYSSLTWYVGSGYYETGWGVVEQPEFEGSFGE